MLIQEFILYLTKEKRYSPHTCTAYQNDIQDFFRYIESEPTLDCCTKLQVADIRVWISTLAEQGIQPRSLRRKASSLRTFFHYLNHRHNVDIQVFRGILLPKIPKRLPQVMDEQALSRDLFEIEESDSFEMIQCKAMFAILYATGMRRQEMINLEWKDIDLHRQSIRILGKGGKERMVPALPELLYLLKQYKQAAQREKISSGSYVFMTPSGNKFDPKVVYNLIKRELYQRTTMEKKSPHILRHSFATHLLTHGANLESVKLLLGHSSLAATQVYAHHSIENLKKIYAQAHPKSRKG